MPPTGSDAYKAIRLEKYFSKHYSGSPSKIFGLLPKEEQDFFLAVTLLNTDEIPVYGIFQDEDTWFLATTRKVTWSRPGFMAALPYWEIQDIGEPEMDTVLSQPEPKSEQEWEDRNAQVKSIKRSMTSLSFEDSRGVRHVATVPPANTLNAIMNSVNYMVQLERIHPSPAD